MPVKPKKEDPEGKPKTAAKPKAAKKPRAKAAKPAVKPDEGGKAPRRAGVPQVPRKG